VYIKTYEEANKEVERIEVEAMQQLKGSTVEEADERVENPLFASCCGFLVADFFFVFGRTMRQPETVAQVKVNRAAMTVILTVRTMMTMRLSLMSKRKRL